VSSRVRGWSDILPHRIDELVAIVRQQFLFIYMKMCQATVDTKIQ
jgi:hypothetical protein